MPDLTRIIVRDFVVPALIGIYPHEHGVLQKMRITVDVTLSATTISTDDISATMSYEGLVREIRALGETHHELVETVAENLAAFALAHPLAESVFVRVEKLEVYPEGSVGTEIIRSKKP